MSTVVVDPHASLPDRLDQGVAYSRNLSHALMLLRARRASREHIDTLWLSCDLGPDQDPEEWDASAVVSALGEEARSGRPFPISQIIVLTHNAERRHQAIVALHPWYDIDAMSPEHSALNLPERRPRRSVDRTPIGRLRQAGVRIEPGLSTEEIETVQKRFDIEFSVPHRSLLQAGLPVDLLADTVWQRPRWPDWRHGSPDELATWIQRAPAPVDATAAVPLPQTCPPLIPLCGNQYLPSGGQLERSWVLSAHEVDVIYYGRDIGAWIGLEFEGDSWAPGRPASKDRIQYWSDLAERLR